MPAIQGESVSGSEELRWTMEVNAIAVGIVNSMVTMLDKSRYRIDVGNIL